MVLFTLCKLCDWHILISHNRTVVRMQAMPEPHHHVLGSYIQYDICMVNINIYKGN